jgi:DNA-directed RNA polymerase subunit RPC12/RpoP
MTKPEGAVEVGKAFSAECAKCGKIFEAFQVLWGNGSVTPWPSCPKCYHKKLYAVVS